MENQNLKDSGDDFMAAGVERLAAVAVERKVLKMAPPPITPVSLPPPPTLEQPAPPPQVIIEKPGIEDAVLAAFAALGFAVSARFLVFLTVVGAFALAVMAMRFHDLMGLAVLGLYCALTVLPLVWLETRAKRKE